MFTKQDDYTKRWHVFMAPFTPLIYEGKMVVFATKPEAEKFILRINK